MANLSISGDFNFLNAPISLGEFSYDRVRGTGVYSIELSKAWLSDFASIKISSDVGNYSGKQYKTAKIFRFLSDAMPDRWGRKLIDKRERLAAGEEHRVPAVFDDYDYLIRLDDYSRMGALRFASLGETIGEDTSGLQVPPLTSLRELISVAEEYEKSERDGTPLHREWVENLFRQGSSLGGARPKANVRDEDGNLCIAKIPSIHDDYDIALWQHFAHQLAKEAGIESADTRLLKLDGIKYHTLLSKRFDRVADKRIHYASAMTLCGLDDGDDASTGHGYPDIAEMMLGENGINNPEANLKELYRRIAFNILVGNHDDHFRNHGFLLTKTGWTLSPAFDLNPDNYLTQSLLISADSNDSSLHKLLEASSMYFLSRSDAETIIAEVREAVKSWRSVAFKCKIGKEEQNRFAKRLSLFL
ncbi:MAG: HipA domain-containing protein [Bacteroidales bacterium]|nr:HipA domain-containing protein [Bacteroidales bacterium]